MKSVLFAVILLLLYGCSSNRPIELKAVAAPEKVILSWKNREHKKCNIYRVSPGSKTRVLAGSTEGEMFEDRISPFIEFRYIVEKINNDKKSVYSEINGMACMDRVIFDKSGGYGLQIYLPPGYDTSDRKYPVLYMMDGDTIFSKAVSSSKKCWGAKETADELISKNRIKDIVIIGIDGRGKKRFPENEILIDEIIPYVEKNYRVIGTKSGRYIAGASGGAGYSLKTAYRYSDMFSGAGLVSMPEFYFATDIIWSEPKQDIRIYISAGSREDKKGFYTESAKNITNLLLYKNYRYRDEFIYHEAKGMDHDENAWSIELKNMLLYFFGGTYSESVKIENEEDDIYTSGAYKKIYNNEIWDNGVTALQPESIKNIEITNEEATNIFSLSDTFGNNRYVKGNKIIKIDGLDYISLKSIVSLMGYVNKNCNYLKEENIIVADNVRINIDLENGIIDDGKIPLVLSQLGLKLYKNKNDEVYIPIFAGFSYFFSNRFILYKGDGKIYSLIESSEFLKKLRENYLETDFYSGINNRVFMEESVRKGVAYVLQRVCGDNYIYLQNKNASPEIYSEMNNMLRNNGKWRILKYGYFYPYSEEIKELVQTKTIPDIKDKYYFKVFTKNKKVVLGDVEAENEIGTVSQGLNLADLRKDIDISKRYYILPDDTVLIEK